jgi:hypothetical protein
MTWCFSGILGFGCLWLHGETMRAAKQLLTLQRTSHTEDRAMQIEPYWQKLSEKITLLWDESLSSLWQSSRRNSLSDKPWNSWHDGPLTHALLVSDHVDSNNPYPLPTPATFESYGTPIRIFFTVPKMLLYHTVVCL